LFILTCNWRAIPMETVHTMHTIDSQSPQNEGFVLSMRLYARDRQKHRELKIPPWNTSQNPKSIVQLF
jgi:hypothetical protein